MFSEFVFVLKLKTKRTSPFGTHEISVLVELTIPSSNLGKLNPHLNMSRRCESLIAMIRSCQNITNVPLN